jgi:hypothetical protein
MVVARIHSMVGSRIDDHLWPESIKNLAGLYMLRDVKIRIIKRKKLFILELRSEVGPELAVGADKRDFHAGNCMSFPPRRQMGDTISISSFIENSIQEKSQVKFSQAEAF